MIRIISAFSMIVWIVSCSSNEVGNSKDVNPDSIYFDYRVWGNEDDEDITVMLQYKFAGKNGTTLVLNEPSKVELDGEQIIVDSSKMTGAYYEVIKPANEFNGKHSIVFTDLNNKQYKEEFSFRPVVLSSAVPTEAKRGDLVFQLEGLNPQDYVRVLLIDTSFASDDINRVDTVYDGRVVIQEKDLKKVVNGPVHLELFREFDRPVKDGTKEGGRLSFSYGLRRDFILKD